MSSLTTLHNDVLLYLKRKLMYMRKYSCWCAYMISRKNLTEITSNIVYMPRQRSLAYRVKKEYMAFPLPKILSYNEIPYSLIHEILFIPSRL